MLRPLGLFRANSNVLHVGRGVARLFFMKMYNYIQFLVSLFQICNSFDQKGGHTVSIRDYSPDFHVDLHTVFD